MVTEVIMPRLSLSMRTGVVLRWYKPVGSLVERGEPICEIEADKAVTDIQAPSPATCSESSRGNPKSFR